MTSVPTFLKNRRADVRDAAPWSPFAYVGRRLREMVREMVAASDLPPGARVLDYGCADQPYRDEFPAGVEYMGADLSGNPIATICLRDDGTIPEADATFDLVLSTQVLEHVTDPAVYVAECSRVLRPGGSLLLSTHGIMYYHRDPEDYWRWTAPGLRRLVEGAGLVVVETRGVLGLVAAGLQLIQDGTYWSIPKFLRRPFALVMQTLIALSDRFYSDASRVTNGLVVAVRATKPRPA